MIVAFLAASLAKTAKASTTSATALRVKIHQQQKRYYHADGYIKAIGHVAFRTVYSPNPRIRHKWQSAITYLFRIRKDSAYKIYRLKHPTPQPVAIPSWLDNAFNCIHRYEGSWTANTGNGYFGGLQMDIDFQRTYGAEFYSKWGAANNWPSWAQKLAAVRAHNSGRGFGPWPNTARYCGLL